MEFLNINLLFLRFSIQQVDSILAASYVHKNFVAGIYSLLKIIKELGLEV